MTMTMRDACITIVIMISTMNYHHHDDNGRYIAQRILMTMTSHNNGNNGDVDGSSKQDQLRSPCEPIMAMIMILTTMAMTMTMMMNHWWLWWLWWQWRWLWWFWWERWLWRLFTKGEPPNQLRSPCEPQLQATPPVHQDFDHFKYLAHQLWIHQIRILITFHWKWVEVGDQLPEGVRVCLWVCQRIAPREGNQPGKWG